MDLRCFSAPWVCAVLIAVACASASSIVNRIPTGDEAILPITNDVQGCFGRLCRKATVKLDKQGHRGARGLMPENTIAAMLKALDFGLDTLEMDTVITQDGQVVLSHEPFFNHEITTKPDGTFIAQANQKFYNIYKMNYSDVLLYDVGLKPHPNYPRQAKMPATKPLLSSVVDAVESYVRTNNLSLPLYNIETKTVATTDDLFHPVPSVFVETLIAVIIDKGLLERVTIQSFDWRTLRYLNEHYPSIQTSMLMESSDQRSVEQHVLELGFVATVYSPSYVQVTKEKVDAAHSLGMKVVPWTVNTAAEMVRLVNLGADGIISDYPDLFEKALSLRRRFIG